MITSTKHKVLLPCFLPIVSSFYIHTSLGSSDMTSTWNCSERAVRRRDLRTLFSWPGKEDQPSLPELSSGEPAQHHHPLCPFYYLWLGTLAGVRTCLAELQNKETDMKNCLCQKQASPEMFVTLDHKNVNNKDLQNVSNDINKLLSGNDSFVATQDLFGTSCPKFLKILAAYMNQNLEKTGPFREDPAQATQSNFVPEASVTIPTTSPSKPSKSDIHPKENGGFRRFFKSAAIHNATVKYHNASFPSVTEHSEPPVVYLPEDLPVDDDFYETILNSSKQLIEVTPPYPIGLLQSMIDVLSAFFEKSPKSHTQVATQCATGKAITTGSDESICPNNIFTKRRGSSSTVTAKSVPANTEKKTSRTSTTPTSVTIPLQRNDFDLGNILFNVSEHWISLPTEETTESINLSKTTQESATLIENYPNVTCSQYPLPSLIDNIYGSNTSKWFHKFYTESVSVNITTTHGALNLTSDQNASCNLPTPKSRMNFFPNFKQKKSTKNFGNGQALNISKIDETHIVAQDIKRKTTAFYSIWGIMGFPHRTKAQPDAAVLQLITESNLSMPNCSYFLEPTGVLEHATVPIISEGKTSMPWWNMTRKKARYSFVTDKNEELDTKRSGDTEESMATRSQENHVTKSNEGVSNHSEREHMAFRNKYLNHNFEGSGVTGYPLDKSVRPLHLNNGQIDVIVYDIPTHPSNVTESDNSFLRRLKHSMAHHCVEII